ncbi:hypothetical protein [Pseudonocardia sp. KRD291]|uniref:hypothetical protein n=1 Tax=Pseudonocardia sp. KRD291 TaxID=2792007 RepID=UPI001C4A1BEE|nr:hypothetical protein [Pseudonocardia sp. KRD291]MBW0101516.1 hypothetical protein [Pseudonocardia sp. KRD291]
MSTASEGAGDHVPTVGERLRAAGLSETRIAAHLTNKVLTLDGVVVADLDQKAPPGSRITIGAS